MGGRAREGWRGEESGEGRGGRDREGEEGRAGLAQCWVTPSYLVYTAIIAALVWCGGCEAQGSV